MDDTPRITELRKKLEKDPGSRLFAQLAEELRKEGRHDEAIELARTGLERHPNYPSARLTLARALMDASRPGEARPELEQVVKGAPDNILAGRLLGEALEELGDAAQALKQLEQTLRFSPGDKPLLQKIADLKASLAAPAPVRPVAAASPPSLSEPLPSVMDEGSRAATPPTAPALDVALPAVAMPETAAPPVPAPATAPAPLDRDLASGTFSPGTLTVPEDLKERFETSRGEEFEPALGPDAKRAPEAPSSPETASATGASTIGFAPSRAEVEQRAAPAAGGSLNELRDLPSVEVPADSDEVGATTLPLNSVTLADLYLQQGLKAEATAVLSQVMKDEPENQEARSKFAAVSAEMAQAGGAPARPEPVPSPPAAPAAAPVAVPGPRRTRTEIRDRSVASLKAFLGAVEREAIEQRATEQGAFR